MIDDMERCWQECVHGNDTYYHEDFKKLRSHEDYFKAGYSSSLKLLYESDCHIEELEHKLELAKEALESISVKEYHCLCNHICKEVLEKLK